MWIDADLVDDSEYSVTTSAQDCFSRVQPGKPHGLLEGQDESVIIIALDSLTTSCAYHNHLQQVSVCFPCATGGAAVIFQMSVLIIDA